LPALQLAHAMRLRFVGMPPDLYLVGKVFDVL
jgi:hypothetical protein